jgi:hypothetical protein
MGKGLFYLVGFGRGRVGQVQGLDARPVHLVATDLARRRVAPMIGHLGNGGLSFLGHVKPGPIAGILPKVFGIDFIQQALHIGIALEMVHRGRVYVGHFAGGTAVTVGPYLLATAP